jgi:hypothetical protein
MNNKIWQIWKSTWINARLGDTTRQSMMILTSHLVPISSYLVSSHAWPAITNVLKYAMDMANKIQSIWCSLRKSDANKENLMLFPCHHMYMRESTVHGPLLRILEPQNFAMYEPTVTAVSCDIKTWCQSSGKTTTKDILILMRCAYLFYPILFLISNMAQGSQDLISDAFLSSTG